MLSFAYYCSGHGYGHATRVSAFASHLLTANSPDRPTVHIISSAPPHVFSDSIALGALYRHADIDPVIVQPLAYRVDRQKSLDVLESFMHEKDKKVQEEVLWLRNNSIDCVLSDAAFLACLAANGASVPSVLITNFTFDSVYSFLSTTIHELSSLETTLRAPLDPYYPDDPLPEDLLAPLVTQIYQGYRCADLLLLLPGKIPIPSFYTEPSLPSSTWVNPHTRAFEPGITQALRSIDTASLLPTTPFPDGTAKSLPRSARQAPLLVRSSGPTIYEPSGRTAFLTSIGIPVQLHDPSQTKILVVSFGGQHFKKPRSRTSSRNSTPSHSRRPSAIDAEITTHQLPSTPPVATPHATLDALHRELENVQIDLRERTERPRLATPSHIHIPGAPPFSKPFASPPPSSVKSPPFFHAITIPPTPPAISREQSKEACVEGVPGLAGIHEDGEAQPRLLPDESWIAVVCGVSPEWAKEDGEQLPHGFYIAPKDVYMPDLMAVSDVLLGKLGYGTVSECVESCTPFVYVSRPLFIEEHGLRLFLSESGVGVELSRSSYEEGDWAVEVEEAWHKGKDAKARRREMGNAATRERMLECDGMARELIEWVEDWKKGPDRSQT